MRERLLPLLPLLPFGLWFCAFAGLVLEGSAGGGGTPLVTSEAVPPNQSELLPARGLYDGKTWTGSASCSGKETTVCRLRGEGRARGEREEKRDRKEASDGRWRRARVMRAWRSGRSWSWVFWIDRKRGREQLW